MKTAEKIISREQAASICADFKEKGKKIGFTSGVFDIMHAGHAAYLEEAAAGCDILVVAVNSDSSVKQNKGEKRPVITQQHRAMLVAALEAVDYVFIFDELKNRDNILALKPDYYFKAGDYNMKGLTSAAYLQEWGGEAKLLSVMPGISTTAIIEKINAVAEPYSFTAVDQQTGYYKKKYTKKRAAVFLDRDGVINEEVEYLHEPDNFKFLPDVLKSLKKIYDMNFVLIIITNQAGIGLGYFTKEDFFKVNKTMLKGFSEYNINIEKIYFCPHSKNDNCPCRKPATGLVDRAVEECCLDPAASFFIGDKTADILTGKKAGMKTVLVKTGHGGSDREYDVTPDFICKDLFQAAAVIEKEKSFG
ncbi:MAG TPA: HAD-IIIA family hydrolase [Spirochaetota bacterium]|nr:HAD-IIIA family hydrolase [Spirochaetota bacterium]